jgi:16S rRNA C1402 (ribose-2'-O) methylase RsmI
MSKGFLPPKKNEVKKLLLSLKELYSDEDRYNRNIKKLYNYVGGEREARKLLKRLEININIFKYSNLTKIK